MKAQFVTPRDKPTRSSVLVKRVNFIGHLANTDLTCTIKSNHQLDIWNEMIVNVSRVQMIFFNIKWRTQLNLQTLFNYPLPRPPINY